LTFDEAARIFSSDETGFYSLGFHPWHADECSTERMTDLTRWANDRRLVALGECGLDKNSRVPFGVQLHVFEQQIALSENIGKPLIIHCVGRFNELFELKSGLNPRQRWIIHGFRGKPELAGQALKAGCSLSFGEYFNPESVRVTPIDRLFVETDESLLPVSEIYRAMSVSKNCRAEALTAGEDFLKSLA
jgi:TatD DNase family protein